MATAAPTALTVVAYDDSWPELFATEAARVSAALGSEVVEVAHVGSTAVPGLAAKPVIDLMAGMVADQPSDDALRSLRKVGYVARARPSTGRVYLRKGRPRTHFLHLTRWDGPEWRDRIAWRDLLRREPAVAGEYASVKRDLSREVAGNRGAYSERKRLFIDRKMREAGLR